MMRSKGELKMAKFSKQFESLDLIFYPIESIVEKGCTCSNSRLHAPAIIK
jgi:hypothetical protein